MSREEILANAKAGLIADQDAAVDKAIGAGYDGGFSEGVASVPPVDGDVQMQIDAAVAAAVGPLNDQIAALNSQVSSMFTADQVHQAVLDEDAKLAAKLKPILDALGASALEQPAE
jgi:hypothetical protein